jgi:cytidine deaminase
MDELLAAAREAQKRAYAPYSNYRVGAAVRADNGKIYQGANVENASYGLSICAERVAISAAIVDGARKIVACAVITASSPPVAPCGMCRQTLAEFADDMPVALSNHLGERSDTTLRQLLPHAFGGKDLT